jgi:hypothetical protein
MTLKFGIITCSSVRLGKKRACSMACTAVWPVPLAPHSHTCLLPTHTLACSSLTHLLAPRTAVTILFASGDSGWQPSQKFGAASPYVTAVGGVYNGELRNRKLQGDSLSTGGFASSALNKAGTWQKAAIASYMNTTGKRPARIGG